MYSICNKAPPHTQNCLLILIKIPLFFQAYFWYKKPAPAFKLHSRLDNQNLNSEALWASFHDFRSKISDFINQISIKPEIGTEFLSLRWFQKCFELIHISHRAFAKFILEIEYPIPNWGERATEEYLNYTLNLLDILNSVTSSLSHLNQSKISVFHDLNRIDNSSSSHLNKIPKICPGKDLELEKVKFFGIEEGSSPISEKESVVLEALMILKKTGFLALGLLRSGLCSDAKYYRDIRSFFGRCDDSIVKGFDSMMEVKGVVEEVKDANDAVEWVSKSGDEASVKELRRRLEILEISIQGIENQANNLFSEVLTIRNKLVDNLRLTGNKSLKS